MVAKRISQQFRVNPRFRTKTREMQLDLWSGHQVFFEYTGTAIVIIEEDATVSLANAEFEKLSGYKKKEIEGKKSWLEFIFKDDQKRMKEYHRLRRIDPTLAPMNYEFKFIDKETRIKDILLTIGMIPGTKRSVASLIDITERKRTEEVLQVTRHFLELSNTHMTMIPLLREFLIAVKKFTGCAAIGIRILDETGNIPYKAYEGFSQKFLKSENTLSIESDHCMCTKVIRGETDSELPFYTKGGSFYVNGTTRFLATVSEKEKEQIRNVCGQFGYEFVSLVPIRLGDRILGLIHVADHKENIFPLEAVTVLEEAALQLGMAIQRVRMEEALRASEERYRTLFEGSRDAIYITIRDGTFVDANQSALDLFGYTREEMITLNARQLYVNPTDVRTFQKAIEQNGFVRDYEVLLRRKDGTEMPCLLTANVRDANDGSILGYEGIIRDITDRKRTEEELAYMATHDPLTGLPNRMLCNDRLTMALAHAHRNKKKLAVMMLDLDRFKEINDTMGHNVGDQLLQAVGNRLKELLRDSDTVARIGGDEFIIVLPEIARIENAILIAQRVLEIMQKPFVFDSYKVHITFSIGVAIYPDNGEDISTIVKNADIAMYHAKKQGRDNYQRFTPTMNVPKTQKVRDVKNVTLTK